jgi:LysR family transcriptional regulator, glycine cleavage system transcriptional activator
MKLPPPSTLKAFEAAVRLQSFARAAQELHLTPAAISQHVRTLEQWLGQPLFIRHAQRLEVTPDGQAFGIAVQDGLSRIAVAAEGIRQKRDRKVTIACISSVATRWLIPRLSAFHRDHPGITLQVVYAFDDSTPRSAGTELLIRHGSTVPGKAERLLSAATRPVCTPDYLARHGPFESASAMLAATLLHDKSTDAWMRWLSEAGVNPPVKLTGAVFEDANLMASATTSHQGIGLIPTVLIRDVLSEGKLVLISETPSDEDKSYWLMEQDEISEAALLLRAWLLNVL